MRTSDALAAILLALGLLSACGGGEPAAEATWETHSTAPDDGAGGEDPAE